MKPDSLMMTFILTFIFAQTKISQSILTTETPNDSSIADETSPPLIIPTLGPVDASFECKVDLLSAYGLTGLATPHNVPLSNCPYIKQTCCSATDDELTEKLWESNKETIEQQYNVYMSVTRYLLGFVNQASRLAYEQSSSTNSDCKMASSDFIALNLNNGTAKEITQSISDSILALGNYRKGFYCAICDASMHSDLNDYWTIDNGSFQNNIYYSKDWCTDLVNRTIASSFNVVSYVKRYVENLGMLVNCKTGNSLKPQINFDYLMRQSVKNCFYFRNRYFFFYCSSYCKHFDLVKKNPLIDGNLKDFKPIFELVSKGRKLAFDDSEDNSLVMWSIKEEELYLENNFDLAIQKNVFFEAETNSKFDLSKFETEVVLLNGINLWDSVNHNSYPISLKSISIINRLFVFLLLGVFRI